MISIDFNVVILGVILVISVAFVGYKWVSKGSLDVKVTNKRLKQYSDYIAELEADNRALKGKVAAAKRIPTVEGSLDTDDNIQAVIGELLPKIAPSLPGPLQGLVNDPRAVKMAMDLYKQNPEKAKGLIQRFVGKNKGGSAENTDFGADGIV